ncbi:hypothetical protein N9A86_02410, partial [Akkermansiaceae bacterium]|nr:hypothetical protein [Akkermansiaceae bacterium]
MIIMVSTISTISLLLTGIAFSFAPLERDEEVADEILDLIKTPRDFAIKDYKLSPESEATIRSYSDEELSRGFATLLHRSDQDPVKGNRAATGNLIVRALTSNKHWISDPSELRMLIANEDNPRHYYLMVRLGASICSERGVDLIPIYFNSLFRDGRVTKEEGEYTPDFADDVSKFAYSRIASKLKKKGAEYVPLDLDGTLLIPHEDQAEHLARWLVVNWPGCENFSLSDQNTPADLFKKSRKRIAGNPRSQETLGVQESKDSTTFSWPL